MTYEERVRELMSVSQGEGAVPLAHRLLQERDQGRAMFIQERGWHEEAQARIAKLEALMTRAAGILADVAEEGIVRMGLMGKLETLLRDLAAEEWLQGVEGRNVRMLIEFVDEQRRNRG